MRYKIILVAYRVAYTLPAWFYPLYVVCRVIMWTAIAALIVILVRLVS